MQFTASNIWFWSTLAHLWTLCFCFLNLHVFGNISSKFLDWNKHSPPKFSRSQLSLSSTTNLTQVGTGFALWKRFCVLHLFEQAASESAPSFLLSYWSTKLVWRGNVLLFHDTKRINLADIVWCQVQKINGHASLFDFTPESLRQYQRTEKDVIDFTVFACFGRYAHNIFSELTQLSLSCFFFLTQFYVCFE